MLIRYDASLPSFFESEETAVAFSHIATSLNESGGVIAMLGAGVSTAAGIQDFRSKDEGLYASSSRRAPSTPSGSRLSAQATRQLFSAQVYTSPTQRAEHWRFLADMKARVDEIARRRKEDDAEPVTAVHGLLATLKQLGKLRRVYTQNIDGLECAEGLKFVPLPGVTAEKVMDRKGKGKALDQEDGWAGDCVQLHGSLSNVRCSACPWVGKWHSKHGKAFSKGETLDCPACLQLAADRARRLKRSTPLRSYLRPALLLYDEQAAASETIADIASADLDSKPTFLLVCGTSLRIPGFKSLVREFAAEVQRNGGIAVFVNREEIGAEWDDVFDYHLLADCDEFVQRIRLESRLSGLNSLERVTKRRRSTSSLESPHSTTPALASSLSITTQQLQLPPATSPLRTSPRLALTRTVSLATNESATSSSSPPPCSDYFAASTSPGTSATSPPPSPCGSLESASFDLDDTPPSSFCIMSSQPEEQEMKLSEPAGVTAEAGMTEKQRRKQVRREKREAKRLKREMKARGRS